MQILRHNVSLLAAWSNGTVAPSPKNSAKYRIFTPEGSVMADVDSRMNQIL